MGHSPTRPYRRHRYAANERGLFSGGCRIPIGRRLLLPEEHVLGRWVRWLSRFCGTKACDDCAATLFRVADEKIAVVLKARMEREPEQALLGSVREHPMADVEEGIPVRQRAYGAAFFDDEEAAAAIGSRRHEEWLIEAAGHRFEL